MFLQSHLSIWTTCLVLIIGTSARSLPKRTPNSSNHETELVQLNYKAIPPFPILDIASLHVLGQMGSNATSAENLTIIASNHRPITENKIPAAKKVPARCGVSFPCDFPQNTSKAPPLRRRDGPAQCGPGVPCADRSCCNSEGKCGFTTYNCGSTATTTCISDCNSYAMCGRDSLDGIQSCPLNICCSYFGYCGTSSTFCQGQVGGPAATPCQDGFGSCEVVSPPSCDASQGSASKGRRVAYYQSGNVRWRTCNRIAPCQIDTTDLTHLIFAFASIDPNSFNIVPWDPSDYALYLQFTDLKSTVMQTWVAIGGASFSDPGPTHTTWSDLCSNSANRAQFITSLITFMEHWGFQGVDLDWEFPTVPSRGGQPQDTENFVALVSEMRAAFGTKFGISIAIPPDYASLSGFDTDSLAPLIDFFNFMAYDLHGTWESSTLGAYVRSQTSILDIGQYLHPLWFDGVNPSKVNLGLAYYGRGYSLSDPSCTNVGCPYNGPNQPGICTNSPGILSLLEIEDLIQQRNLVPTLLGDEMIKQIVFDDQWIGYDDADTFALKKAWADSRCLGGTTIWSIDLYSGHGSGDTPISMTTTGTCGSATSTSCFGSVFGDCCSENNYCGNGHAYCYSSNGCQVEFGACTGEVIVVSTDASCGESHNKITTCKGSEFGNCCSKHGWCGSSDDYCAVANGCQLAFGICG